MRRGVIAWTMMLSLAGSAAAAGPDLIGVTRATAIAERALAARAMEVALEGRGGRLVYEIDLVRAGQLHHALVDAHTGTISDISQPLIEGRLRSWIDPQRFRRAEQARPLAETLAAIEERTGGEVHSVAFGIRKDRALYAMEIATAAGAAVMEVDVVSGRRLAMHLPAE